jgi:predicted nucleotidyltransferase
LNLEAAVVAAVSPHPAVERIELVGSRAEGRATEWSDWDFGVRARKFAAVAEALPALLAQLEPLAQQWDRLSETWCWMLILRGPVKVDLIFPDPHEKEPPWEPGSETLGGIDDHFWDWMLWLHAKEAVGKDELVETELRKPIAEAVESYRAARDRAEVRYGRIVDRALEQAVAPSLRSPE